MLGVTASGTKVVVGTTIAVTGSVTIPVPIGGMTAGLATLAAGGGIYYMSSGGSGAGSGSGNFDPSKLPEVQKGKDELATLKQLLDVFEWSYKHWTSIGNFKKAGQVAQFIEKIESQMTSIAEWIKLLGG